MVFLLPSSTHFLFSACIWFYTDFFHDFKHVYIAKTVVYIPKTAGYNYRCQQFGNSIILESIMNVHAGQQNLTREVRISTRDKPAQSHGQECKNIM